MIDRLIDRLTQSGGKKVNLDTQEIHGLCSRIRTWKVWTLVRWFFSPGSRRAAVSDWRRASQNQPVPIVSGRQMNLKCFTFPTDRLPSSSEPCFRKDPEQEDELQEHVTDRRPKSNMSVVFMDGIMKKNCNDSHFH